MAAAIATSPLRLVQAGAYKSQYKIRRIEEPNHTGLKTFRFRSRPEHT
jgi:hypothetical protein